MSLVIRKCDGCVVAVIGSTDEVVVVNEHVVTIRGATFGGDGGFDILDAAEGEEVVGLFHTGNGVFTAPSAPESPVETQEEVDARRAERLRDINTRCSNVIGRLQEGYPADEVLSWTQQVAEAKALLADAQAAAPLVRAIATGRGVEVMLLAQKIIQKAEAFAVFSGAAIGNRQRLEDALHAAGTLAEVLDVDLEAGWPALG